MTYSSEIRTKASRNFILMFSACGQLVQKKEKEEESKEPIDIEDVVGAAATSKRHEGIAASSKTPEMGAYMADNKDKSWIESLSTENLSRLENALTVAACISASCFLTSTWLMVKKR